MRSKSADMPLKSFAKLLTKGQGGSYTKIHSCLTTGNSKLPSTTAIFNMSSAHECPSLKLGLCRAFTKDGKHVCYARKFETARFPGVQSHRDNQMRFWLTTTAEEFAWQFLLVNALKEVPFNSLRFSEAGDFHMQSCVNKMERIATILKSYDIKVYGYTCRSDLDFSNVRNMIISGTSFQKEGITNVFMMVEDIKDRPKGFGVCAGDCKICNRCMVRGKMTVVKRH